MRRSAHTLTAFALAVLLSTVVLPSLAEDEGKAWDQAVVTDLAKQLAETAGDLRTSVRRTPIPQSGSMRRNQFRVLDDLRVISNSINSLARRLESGEGRSETYPTFRRIRMLRNDLAVQVRRVGFGEPTVTKLAAAKGLVDQLNPFYVGEMSDD